MSILVSAAMPPNSAVAAQTLMLVEALARTDHVEVWVPEGQDAMDLPVTCREFNPADPLDIATAKRFTHVIHVMSGNFNCAEVGLLARNVPGVVVLHDISMLLTLDHVVMSGGGRRDLLIDLVREMHGPATASQLELNFVYPGTGVETPSLHRAAHSLPFFLNAATAVVTHSDWAAGEVQRAVSVPVLVAPLPAEPYGQPHEMVATGPRPMVVPGIVNMHKLVATAIEGFAQSGLAADGHDMVVLGRCDPRLEAHLKLTARRHGVHDALVFMAPERDEDFLQVLGGALAVVALRQHNTEAQSAALLAGLLSGRPVIATDAGCTVDVPDDLMLKVPDGGATPAVASAVADALATVAREPAATTAMAARAGEWVRARHTLPGYEAVVRQALAVHEARLPQVETMVEIGDRLVAAGLADDPAAAQALADALESLGS